MRGRGGRLTEEREAAPPGHPSGFDKLAPACHSWFMAQSSSRVLIVGFHSPLNQGALTQALEESEARGTALEFIALVSRSNFLGARADEFIDSSDGFKSRGFEASKAWPFPSRQLWEDLRSAESVAYRMMERVHRVARAGKTIELQKRRWYEWVAFTYGFLKHHRIDRVVQCNVPHFPFQYALHETARAIGIETRFLMQLQIKETYLIASSIDGIYGPLRRALEDAGEQGRPELEGRMRDELDRRTTRHQPFYMHSKGIPLRTRYYAFQRRFLRGAIRSIPSKRAYRAARRAGGEAPSEGTPYVYVPLHLQPEAPTLPLGDVYVDQLLMVETLVRALPDGWLIVVKENPKQRLEKRDASFYRRLEQLDCVRLVGRDANSFDLLHGSQAVATITGTAGWEALCTGKPTLTFGHAVYRHARGSVAVESVEQLRDALASIAAGDFPNATVDDCARFLGALQTVTYAGISEEEYLRDSEHDAESAARACSAAMAEALGIGAPTGAPDHPRSRATADTRPQGAER